MSRQVLAMCDCPECVADGMTGTAEIKRTKAGLLYRWCVECSAQYFPRTVEASDRLGRSAGIGTGTGTGAAPVAVAVPKVTAAPVAVKVTKKAGLWFEGLGGES